MELRVRAWDKIKGRYFNTDIVDFITWMKPSNWRELYEVELFSSIVDKSGQEWCEGDILGCTYKRDKSKCIVAFDGIQFIRRGIGENSYDIEMGVDDIDFWKKIGNIHENKDLLT